MGKHKAELAILLGMGLALSACAAPRRQVYRFTNLGFTVRVMPHRSITAAECGSPRQDDGRELEPSRHLSGCWRPKEREIWIDEQYPEALIHELAHADGWRTASADQLHWR